MVWTVGLAAEAVGADAGGAAALELAGISTDTRRLVAGSLFVALRGERFDGHDYLATAAAAGAVAAVVSRDVPAPDGMVLLRVADTLAAYGALGRCWRRRHDVQVIGITGSTGKSSTKQTLATVLGTKLPTLANEANFNNEIGVPATLLQLTPEHRVAVLEMAMRGPGQISELCELAEPTIGVITNIGLSHLGVLGSREAIACAKGELLEHLGSQGVAVLNADDPFLPEQAVRHGGRTLWYGAGPTADIRATDIKLHGLSGSVFRLETPRGGATVRFGLPGQHMVLNALAASGAAYAAGFDPAAIAAGLEACRHLPLRLEVVALAEGVRVINDSYNAAPDSMRAALSVLAAEPTKGRRIACLGDMLEMGEVAEAEHLRVGHAAAEAADVIVGVGELGRLIVAGAQDMGHATVVAVPDAAAAGAWLASSLQAGDLVLLKASRAVGLERALESLERAR